MIETYYTEKWDRNILIKRINVLPRSVRFQQHFTRVKATERVHAELKLQEGIFPESPYFTGKLEKEKKFSHAPFSYQSVDCDQLLAGSDEAAEGPLS